MLDAKKIAELDQAATALGETVPRLSKSLFDGFIREGFSHNDAITFTLGYLGVLITSNSSKPNDDL